MRSATRNRGGPRELCALLGHELRNPLAAAITSVSLASAQMDSTDPRAGHLRGALQDLSRLSTLLSAYLEYGRGGSVSRREIDLVAVVQAISSRVHSTSVDARVDEACVHGDPDLLGRAFENLLENAMQAGASDVTMRISCREGVAIVDVIDNGPGVPVELHESVFDPFVSGRGSSGLGLAVAQDVIERHGGRITLLPPDRRRPGATFEVALPIEERVSVETDFR